MKKITLALFCIFLLCGCQNHTMSEPQYLISSLGFDVTDGDYTVTVEAVVINSDTAEADRKTLSGRAANIPLCLDEIYRKSTQLAEFSHCGIVAIGDSVDGKTLKKILDFCYSKDEINLSAYFVATHNAKKLLETKPVSSVAVGYDIIGLLSQYKTQTKTDYTNKFYQVEAARLRNDTLYFPIVSQEDGELILSDARGVSLNEN